MRATMLLRRCRSRRGDDFDRQSPPGEVDARPSSDAPVRHERQSTEAQFSGYMMEVNMTRKGLMFLIAVVFATLGGGSLAWSEDADQATLIKALPGAKLTLLQGIAQVAKGTEVPIEAKYEMADGKLMLSIYTSAKGFDTAAEDNSFNEHIGEVTTTTWTPKKEVFADLKHIARSAQYHALLSMTKVTIPAIIQKASAQGTILSVKEKIRNGKPVFEVMVVQGNTINPTFYDLVSGEPTAG